MNPHQNTQKYREVHPPRESLRVLCLLFDPAFLVVFITNFSPLHLPFPMVFATPESPGLTGMPFDPGMPEKPNKDH